MTQKEINKSAAENAEDLRKEAKELLNSITGEGYGNDVDRLVDCIIAVAMIEISIVYKQAAKP